jgi:hypothetical protein
VFVTGPVVLHAVVAASDEPSPEHLEAHPHLIDVYDSHRSVVPPAEYFERTHPIDCEA